MKYQKRLLIGFSFLLILTGLNLASAYTATYDPSYPYFAAGSYGIQTNLRVTAKSYTPTTWRLDVSVELINYDAIPEAATVKFVVKDMTTGVVEYISSEVSLLNDDGGLIFRDYKAVYNINVDANHWIDVSVYRVVAGMLWNPYLSVTFKTTVGCNQGFT